MLARRTFVAAAAAALARPALAQSPGGGMERAITKALREGQPFRLPPGTAQIENLTLPENAHLSGIRGRSILSVSGTLSAKGGERLTLEGVTIEGAPAQRPEGRGLIELTDIRDLLVRDCRFSRGGGDGLRLARCGGRVRDSAFTHFARGGLFSIDATGLAIEGNSVSHCGENGIQVWRSAKGDDGTRVSGNRVSDILADAGGSGQYGNAISVFRAGGVIVEGNHARRCAYTAVRNNSGANIIIANNSAAGMGECAIYVEFGFDGAAVTGNVIDGAMMGISVTNFADQGGRLASVTGNIVRNLARKTHPGTGKLEFGIGIAAEGDVTLTGNTIENADYAGMMLGWGPSLRDVTAAGNTIRNSGTGIMVSAAPGAGSAAITGNTISGSRRAAILGMAWDKPVTGDLGRDPSAAPANIRLAANTIL